MGGLAEERFVEGSFGARTAQVFAAVLAEVLDLDAVQLADALWLAALTASVQRVGPAGTTPKEDPDPPRSPGAVAGSPQAADRPTASAYDADFVSGEVQGDDTLVQVPRTKSFPRTLEIGRALRPFRQRCTPGRRGELDLDATVEAYSRTEEVVPIQRPASERWFDVILIVDDAWGVRVWDSSIDGLENLLRGLGLFRSVERARLTAYVDHRGATVRSRSGRLRRPGRDGSRYLTLVFSDFAADAWYGTAVWEVLADWAKAGPAVLVDPLPPALRRHTGLNRPTARASARFRGSPNHQLQAHGSGAALGTTLMFPVVSLSPHSWASWADMVMRAVPRGSEAVVVGGEDLPRPVREAHLLASPDRLVESFTHAASEYAERLAVLCSQFEEISLPLLHLVREQVLPEAALSDVAELILSGLLVLVPSEDGVSALRFRPGVQHILMERLTEREAWRVQDVQSQYVAERARLSPTQGPARRRAPIPREHRFGEWLGPHLAAKGWKGADLSRASATVRAEPYGTRTVGKWLNNQGSPPSVQTALEVADLVEGDRIEALRAASYGLIADAVEAAGTGKIVTRDPYVEKVLGYDLPEEDKAALIRLYRNEVERARQRTDQTAALLAKRAIS